VISYFSLLYAHKVVVPIDVSINRDSLEHILNYCEIKTIVTNNKNECKLRAILAENITEVQIFILDDILPSKIVDWFPDAYSDDDVAILLYTSGTTSTPKRVMLTHKNITSNAKSVCKSLQLNSSDISLIIMPIYLSSGHMQFISHMMIGGTIVIYDNIFHVATIKSHIQKYVVTNFCCVSFMLFKILDKTDFFESIQSLRMICIGADKVPQSLINSFLQNVPHIELIHYYGLSEASPRLTHINRRELLNKAGSVGKPIDGVEISIFDNDKKCEVNCIGEIVARGDNVFLGYFKNEEETKKVLRNGWLYTGDQGFVRA
jgi:long-chain acyl-CoA synthetase